MYDFLFMMKQKIIHVFVETFVDCFIQTYLQDAAGKKIDLNIKMVIDGRLLRYFLKIYAV